MSTLYNMFEAYHFSISWYMKFGNFNRCCIDGGIPHEEPVSAVREDFLYRYSFRNECNLYVGIRLYCFRSRLTIFSHAPLGNSRDEISGWKDSNLGRQIKIKNIYLRMAYMCICLYNPLCTQSVWPYLLSLRIHFLWRQGYRISTYT